jgi:hypothetical protein
MTIPLRDFPLNSSSHNCISPRGFSPKIFDIVVWIWKNPLGEKSFRGMVFRGMVFRGNGC